jgi:hypothetical protein
MSPGIYKGIDSGTKDHLKPLIIPARGFKE